jgi:DNA polymerase III delta prime subunit
MIIGHKKQREILKRSLEAGQMAHAYLFVGQEGIGKKMLALEFAESIGCKFPDLLVVSEANKKDSKFGGHPLGLGEIKISQIREIQNFLAYKSYNGGYKIVVVDEAEKMNVEAQNCFLKTLEEPKGNTLIILVSAKPDMMLPTIVSRCQIVKFFKPKNLPENSEKIKKDKEILDGLLPVLNSNLAEKFKYVKSIDFEKTDPRKIIEVLQKHFRKQILDGSAKKETRNFLKLSEEISQKLLFTNANAKLALEILLMEI